MANLVRIIEQYVGKCRKLSFQLKDGQEYFGWLGLQYDESNENIDYSADFVMFLRAPSPFDNPALDGIEEVVRLEDIDLDSLYYYDDAKSGWIKFAPDVRET